MKSLEQEHMAFKQAMFKESIYLNHNYIRVSKACLPVLNMLGGGNGLYHLLFVDVCWLVFLPDELVIVNEKITSKNEVFNYSLTRINYKEITKFSVEKVPFWGEFCLKIKCNWKRMYFYIDGDDDLTFGKTTFSSFNFQFLLKNNFYGLLK